MTTEPKVISALRHLSYSIVFEVGNQRFTELDILDAYDDACIAREIARTQRDDAVALLRTLRSTDEEPSMSKPSELRLDFTGRMSVVIELQDYGPMEFRVDDLEVVKRVVRVILDASAGDMDVNEQTKQQSRRLKKVLTDGAHA